MLKKNVENRIEKTNTMKSEDMTYTELVSQELNANLAIVDKEIADIKNKISEVTVDLNRKGKGNDTRLIEVINKLRDDAVRKDKERYKITNEYAVDYELIFLAAQLDRADRNNEGMDLLYKLSQKIGDAYLMMPEINKCYGNITYAPVVYHQISGQLQALVNAISYNLPKIQRTDKESLKQKLEERMVIINKAK